MDNSRRKVLKTLGATPLAFMFEGVEQDQDSNATPTAHDFSWAFTKMREGYGIRRKGWNVHYFVIGDQIFLWNYGGKIYMPILDTMDIMARDWETI